MTLVECLQLFQNVPGMLGGKKAKQKKIMEINIRIKSENE